MKPYSDIKNVELKMANYFPKVHNFKTELYRLSYTYFYKYLNIY